MKDKKILIIEIIALILVCIVWGSLYLKKQRTEKEQERAGEEFRERMRQEMMDNERNLNRDVIMYQQKNGDGFTTVEMN